MILTSRASLAEALWSYGEDDLYKRIAQLTDSEMHVIGTRADEIVQQTPSRRTDGSSLYLAQGLALAAVEFLEGKARPLALSRRRASKDYPKDSGASEAVPLPFG